MKDNKLAQDQCKACIGIDLNYVKRLIDDFRKGIDSSNRYSKLCRRHKKTFLDGCAT